MEHAMSSKQGVALAFKAVATLLASLWAATSHATTELYYVHTDHLGTPQVMTDKNQEVVWKRSQTPFGETVEDSGTVEQPLRFPGQYADLEMGLNYNYYRDYDPSLGRYVQSDPIGLRGGINTYGYALQNPLYYIDPNGLTSLAGCANPANAAACEAAGIGGGSRASGAANTAGVSLWCLLTGNCAANENASQNEKKPKNCPSGTQDIDKAKKKYGWDKDTLHGIKDAAHGGMGTGKSWTGVAPDGTVGINEGGE